jgi:pimeloyl-ACP methyl ester carboxylesterase
MPIICEADKMQRLFCLEKDFTVAYWDQRACGKSFDKSVESSTINLAQLADDLIACSKYLTSKYNKEKIILIGYSIGAAISLMAASKNTKLFSQLFLVSTDVDMSQANKYAIEFAIKKAGESHKPKLLRQANSLQGIEISTDKLFQQRAKLLSNLGGMMSGKNYTDMLLSTIFNMLSSKAYRLSDIPKTIKGMGFCQNALLAELNTLDLFRQVKEVDCPVHFMHGTQSGISPYQLAMDYYGYLKSPGKKFTTFEHSAHMLHYDQPKKFASVIRENIINNL